MQTFKNEEGVKENKKQALNGAEKLT